MGLPCFLKSLQKVSADGQRIHHLTSANQALALANIHHDEATTADIVTALNAGKEVITHTDAVSVPGWKGAGYIILDPETGVGAYMISGGGNGGWIDIAGAILLAAPLWISVSFVAPQLAVAFNVMMAISVGMLIYAAALANSGYIEAAEFLCNSAVWMITAALVLLIKNPLIAGTVAAKVASVIGVGIISYIPGKGCSLSND